MLGITRRHFFRDCGYGVGKAALASLLCASARAGDAGPGPLAPKKPHFAGKAKAVIWLFMNGGPSQVDTWDHKPELEKRDW